MKKAGLTVVLVLAAALGAFAQKSPGNFYPYSTPSYYEAEGYCIVEGVRFHYWLYNTYRDWNGDSSLLIKAFMDYAESLGYTVDYDNIIKASPHTNFPNSVKAMMSAKNSDIAMTIARYDGSPAMLVHNYDAEKDNYATWFFRLVK
jgi:hypothetical protein